MRATWVDLRLALARARRRRPRGGVGGLLVGILLSAIILQVFHELGVDLPVESSEEAVRKVRGFPIADGVGPFLGELVGQAGDLAPREGGAETFGGWHAHRRAHDPISAPRAGEGEADAEGLLTEATDRGARRDRIRPEQEDRLTLDVAHQHVAIHIGQRTTQGQPSGGAPDKEAAGGQVGPGLLGDQLGADPCHALAPIEQSLRGVPLISLRRRW